MITDNENEQIPLIKNNEQSSPYNKFLIILEPINKNLLLEMFMEMRIFYQSSFSIGPI
jgi:hypothetical protein